MQVREGFRVYESIMDENEGVLEEMYTSNNLPLLMDTLNTKPGFTKLKLYNKVRIHTNTMQLTDKWSYTFGNDTFLSSKIIRESELYPGTVIHGPCQSVPDILDIADCFRCKEWILQAEQWIDRPRSTWPDYKLVTTVCTTDKIIVRMSNSLKEQTVFQKIKQAVGLCLTCKHFILQDVRFINPFHLLPIELITLTTIYKNVKIPPVVYCNMLLFLCFHHLHDASGKRNAVRGLELTIREMCFIDEDRRQVLRDN
ncbi:unnamed protein product [Mytilus coruscus]|uniref:Uncharacterized protein n=1 Tax=Mytilus coruscus TaxID=42192 RepID=A0A6J8B5Q6_MYTCO|nr:unnamed protein product [Mytilus coruscus]